MKNGFAFRNSLQSVGLRIDHSNDDFDRIFKVPKTYILLECPFHQITTLQIPFYEEVWRVLQSEYFQT